MVRGNACVFVTIVTAHLLTLSLSISSASEFDSFVKLAYVDAALGKAGTGSSEQWSASDRPQKTMFDFQAMDVLRKSLEYPLDRAEQYVVSCWAFMGWMQEAHRSASL
jgi:hypothetical protein